MRKKLSKRGSKRLFRATATKVHRKNVRRPMRGGIRL
ncbi:DNA binding protein [Sigmofec virus UA08Rod_6451]|uniref:DNA binding protein n=1 Tax=Sigmofec virus UA08Rod_6451 TaxID=2929230 RepID=A0A976R6T9_9VIRU|nr:DNA binding protein [Sigmofec virus UA08Rod_6451]